MHASLTRQLGALLVATLSSILPAHAQILFEDHDFQASDWTVFNKYSGAALTQETAGGNPGNFGYITGPAPLAASPDFVGELDFIRNGATYVPETSGGISSITVSVDVNPTVPNIRDIYRDYFLINAGGSLYGYTLASSNYFDISFFHGPIDPSAWVTLTLTITPSTVPNSIYPNHGQTITPPDFSAGGSPMQFGFGYLYYIEAYSSNLPTGIGIDNYTVTVNQVPEPTSASFLAFGGLFISLRKRRHPPAVAC